jgi:hypothetical protein
MDFLPASVTPPAYKLKNIVKRAKLAALTALFGCQHVNTDIPFADQQTCKDCSAVRDYIFSLRWRKEYKDILRDWQDNLLTPEEFAQIFHERLEKANAAFIGEWRREAPFPYRAGPPRTCCNECGHILSASGGAQVATFRLI